MIFTDIDRISFEFASSAAVATPLTISSIVVAPEASSCLTYALLTTAGLTIRRRRATRL